MRRSMASRLLVPAKDLPLTDFIIHHRYDRLLREIENRRKQRLHVHPTVIDFAIDSRAGSITVESTEVAPVGADNEEGEQRCS